MFYYCYGVLRGAHFNLVTDYNNVLPQHLKILNVTNFKKHVKHNMLITLIVYNVDEFIEHCSCVIIFVLDIAIQSISV